MTPQRVLALLELLEGLAVWVDGGWGVDALVGRQTRDAGTSTWGSCGPISKRLQAQSMRHRIDCTEVAGWSEARTSCPLVSRR